MILALRTDRPQAELYLLDDAADITARHQWLADRQLADRLLAETKDFLKRQKLDFKDLTGVVVYRGPGSFTGLRIGVTVANSLAYGLGIPVTASAGKDWLEKGVIGLKKARLGRWAMPEYGAPAKVTLPNRGK